MPTIDERVVEMRFDNKDFERNVHTSLGTIDKLKKSLDFENAGKGLEDLQQASKHFSLSNVANEFESLNNKLDWKDIFKISLLNNVVTEAVNAVKTGIARIKSELHLNTIDPWSNASIGFQKFGEKTMSVATIMGATGKSIDEVNEKMERLNYFTDETSYDFTDMANNIGKFTSAGVDLEEATVAMEGISTWAAKSGQEKGAASRVMYNLSQAIGMGTLKVIDWKSVELANMATKEFKEHLIDTGLAMGTLTTNSKGLVVVNNENAETMQAVEVTAEHLRDTLNTGWVDKDVLVTTLNEYGKAAELIADVHQATGLYAKEILDLVDIQREGQLGNNELAEALGISESQIDANADAINGLREAIELLASEEYEFSLGTYRAAQEARTFEQAMLSAQDAVSTAWMNVFENIFGNYEQSKVLWSDLAENLFDVFTWLPNTINAVLTDANTSGWESFSTALDNVGVGFEDLRTSLSTIVGNDALRKMIGDAESFEQALAEGRFETDLIYQAIDKLSSRIESIGIYDILRELKDFAKGGSVDLLHRPIVEAAELLKAGWKDAGEGAATVFTSTFTDKTGTIAANFTPIWVDEHGKVIKILSPEELTKYAESILDTGATDTMQLQIGGLFEGSGALESAELAAQRIHDLHEEFFLGRGALLTEINDFDKFKETLTGTGHTMDDLYQSLVHVSSTTAIDEMIKGAGGFEQAIQKGIIPVELLAKAIDDLMPPTEAVGNAAEISAEKFKEYSDMAVKIRQGKYGWIGHDDQVERIVAEGKYTKEEAEAIVQLAEAQHEVHRELTMEEVKELGLLKGMTDESIKSLEAKKDLTDEEKELLKQYYDQRNKIAAQQSFISGLINVGHTFAKVIEQIREGLLEMFPPITGERLAELAYNFEQSTRAVREFVEGSTAVKSITKVLLLPFRLLVDLVGAAFSLLPSIGSLLLTLASPLVFIVTKIGDFISALQEATGEASPFTSVIYKIADAISTVIGFIVAVGKYVGNIVKNRFVEKFSDTFYELAAAFKQFKDDKLKAFDVFLDKIKNADIEAIGNAIIGILLKIWHLSEPIRKFIKMIPKGFSYIGKAVDDFKRRFHIIDIANKDMPIVEKAFKALQGTIRKSLSVIKEKLKEHGIDIGDIQAKYDEFSKKVGVFFAPLVSKIAKVEKFLKDIKKTFTDTLDSFKDSSDISSFEKIWKSIKAVAEFAFEKIKNKIKSVLSEMGIDVEGLRGKYDAFIESVTQKFENLNSEIEKVKNFLKDIKKKFTDTFDGFSENSELSTFEKVWESIKATAEYAFERIKEKAKNVLTEMGYNVDDLKAKFDKVKTTLLLVFSPILAIFGGIVYIISKVTSVISDFKRRFHIVDVANKEMSTVEKIFLSLQGTAASVVDKIKEKIRSIFDGTIEVPDWLQNIIDKLTVIYGYIVDIYDKAKNAFTTKFNELVGTDEDGKKLINFAAIYESIKAAAESAFNRIKELIKENGINIETIKAKIKSFKDTILEFFGITQEGVETEEGKKGIFSSLYEDVKQHIPKILAILGATAGGIGLGKILADFFNLKDKGIKEFLNGKFSDKLSDAANSISPLKKIATGFNILAFAGAITLLAIALGKFASIPAEDAVRSIELMGAAIAGLIGTMLAASKLFGDEGGFQLFGSKDGVKMMGMKMLDLGLGMYFVAKALLVFADAIKAYQELDFSDGSFSQVIKVLLMAVISLSILAKKAGKFHFNLSGGLGLIAAVGALYLFGKMLESYRDLDLGPSFGKIVKILLSAVIALSIVAKAAGKAKFKLSNGLGLIAAAGALYLMGLTLERFGKIDDETFKQGIKVLAALAAILAGVGLVLGLVTKNSRYGSGLAAIAITVSVVLGLIGLAGLMVGLGKVPNEIVVKGRLLLVELSVLFTALIGLMGIIASLNGAKKMLAVTAMIGAVIAALIALSAIIVMFGLIPQYVIDKGTKVLGIMLLSLFGITAMIAFGATYVDIKSGYAFIGMLALFVLAIAGLAYTVSKLQNIKYEKARDNLKLIGILLGAFAGFVVLAGAAGFLSSKLKNGKSFMAGMGIVSGMLAEFVGAIYVLTLCLEKLQNINPDAAKKGVDLIGQILLYFVGFILIAGVIGGIAMATGPLFLTGLAAVALGFLVFIGGIMLLVHEVEKLSKIDSGKANEGIAAVSNLLDLIIGLGKKVNDQGGGIIGAAVSSIESWMFGTALMPLVADVAVLGGSDADNAIYGIKAVDALLDYMISLADKFNNEENQVTFHQALSTSAKAFLFGAGLLPLSIDTLILGLSNTDNAIAAISVVEDLINLMIKVAELINKKVITFASASVTSAVMFEFGLGLLPLVGAEWLAGKVNATVANSTIKDILTLIDKFVEVATKLGENEAIYDGAIVAGDTLKRFARNVARLIGDAALASLLDEQRSAAGLGVVYTILEQFIKIVKLFDGEQIRLGAPVAVKALKAFAVAVGGLVLDATVAQLINYQKAADGLRAVSDLIDEFLALAEKFKDAGLQTAAWLAAKSLTLFAVAVGGLVIDSTIAQLISFDKSMEGIGVVKELIGEFVQLATDLGTEDKWTAAQKVADALATFATEALAPLTVEAFFARFIDAQAALDALDPVDKVIGILVRAATAFNDNEGLFESAQQVSSSVSDFADTLKDIGGANKKLTKGDADETLKALGPVEQIIGMLIGMAKEFTTHSGMASNAITASSVLSTFGNNIATISDQIANTGLFTSWSEEKANIITAVFGALAEGIVKLAAVDGDLASAGNVISGLGKILGFVQWVTTTNLITGTKANSEKLSIIAQVINELNTALGGFHPEFAQTGAEAVTQFIEGIENLADNAHTAGANIAYEAYMGGVPYVKSFKTLGEFMANGLANGIAAGSYNVIDVVKTMCENAVQTVRNILKINSPSKVFREIGLGIPEGTAEGVQNGGYLVNNSIDQMAQNTISAMQLAMSNINAVMADDTFTPTIAPVIDLSNASGMISSLHSQMGELNLNGGKYQIDGELIERGASNRNIINEISRVSDRLEMLGERIENMQIVLDSGVLVGATSAQMDAQFGIMNMRKGRGN